MTFDHVYVSPHPDDVALSCGGTVAQQTARGERVLVVTLCAGEPPEQFRLPAFVEEAYRTVGIDLADVVRVRRREELEAIEILGAELELKDELDAIYRLPERYSSAEAVFGEIADGDPLLATAAEIARRVAPGAVLHAPLGVGGHVDHRIAHLAAANAGRDVAFYEDFPYVARSEQALEVRLSEMADQLQPVVVDISSSIALRLRAIRVYQSQVALLGGDLEPLVLEYARRLGNGVPSERSWIRGARG